MRMLEQLQHLGREQLRVRHTLVWLLLSVVAVWLTRASWMSLWWFDAHSMAWNLFLAWIPWMIARRAEKRDARAPLSTPVLLAYGVAWLAFFPNAPYVVTDLIHVRMVPQLDTLVATLAIVAGACAGVGVGLSSLRTMASLVRARLGARGAHLFVVTSSFLAGFGIYLGRVARWNTWDLVFNPSELGGHVRALVLHPPPLALGITLVFGLGLLALHTWSERRAVHV